MASTDNRPGFRLPWSTDRAPESTADRAPESTASQVTGDDAPVPDPSPVPPPMAWPEQDFASRLGLQVARQWPADTRPTDGEPGSSPDLPTLTAAPSPNPPAVPRKSTKLMAELAAAIRATTEAARDQRLSALEAEAGAVIELIRAQSEEGLVALRGRADDDVAAVRDWAKAEIARIRETSEIRIADRKHLLERELADHAAAIEDRCAEVQSSVANFRRSMDGYFERLAAEDDPARLATMAESMPEPPSVEPLADLDSLVVEGAAARRADADGAAEAAWAVPGTAGSADTSDDGPERPLEDGRPDTVAESDEDAPEARTPAAEPGAAAEGDGDGAQAGPDGFSRWGADDLPAAAPGDAPDGEGGDPVDRGAIMAALEAAAEAVVAAEAAAESAETAEAAADAAETAAELVAGRAGQPPEGDPEAQAALAARVGAGGFETESYQDRLASLLPGHGGPAAEGEPRVTQVVVTGLASVASIASFKRHLGRIAGVAAVAVSSGPDGEFIFNATHRPDISFRDAIPTMPGFAARVVATGDGSVSVTARDPEAEG